MIRSLAQMNGNINNRSNAGIPLFAPDTVREIQSGDFGMTLNYRSTQVNLHICIWNERNVYIHDSLGNKLRF